MTSQCYGLVIVTEYLVYTTTEQYDISFTEHAGPYLGRQPDTESSTLA